MPCFLYFCLQYQDICPSDMEDKLIELIENSIKKNWDRKAFTDFNGESLQYKDVARKIAKMHLLFGRYPSWRQNRFVWT